MAKDKLTKAEREKIILRYIKDLSHNDRVVRKHAAWMLTRFAERGDAKIIVGLGGVPPLIKCLSDSSIIVCYRAVWAIATLGKMGEAQTIVEAGAIPLLERLTADTTEVSILNPYTNSLEWTTVGKLAVDALEHLRKNLMVVRREAHFNFPVNTWNS